MRRLLACCLLTALSSVTLAGSQVFSRPGRPSTDTPFGFLNVPRTLGGSSAGKLLPAWFANVEAHEPGKWDEAARVVANWNHRDLVDVILASKTAPRGTLEEMGYRRRVERAVLLHTDIATLLMLGAAVTPDSVWVSETPSLHFGAALELVDWLHRQSPGEGPFVRGWYRMTAAFLVSQHETVSSPVFLERAMKRFRDDPALLLMAGSVHEMLASPRIQEGEDFRYIDKCGSADDNLIYAEQLYRAALEVDASLTEARVRLGHVTGLRGNHRQALAELKRVTGDVAPPVTAYVLHLFTGEEEQALNDPEAARTEYGKAIELLPQIQFAYFALSRLERHDGDKAAAVQAIQTMVRMPQDEWSDVWAEYYAPGLARQPDLLLEHFHMPFRSKQ